MALISAICPDCKEAIKLDDAKSYGFCLNCGAKILIGALAKDSSYNSGPSQHVMENYLQLAVNAKASGNNAQCEEYCNKVIELDSSNVVAWTLKGSSAGWQSSLNNIRVDEMLLSFGKAIQYSPDSTVTQKIREQAEKEFRDVWLAVFSLQCQRFEKWTDEEESNAFSSLHISLLNTVKTFLIYIGVNCDWQSIAQAAAVQVEKAAANAEQKVKSDYENSNDGRPTDFAFSQLIEKMGYCHTVHIEAASLGEGDLANTILCYYNAILNDRYCLGAKSYKKVWNGNYFEWRISKMLSEDTASFLRSRISEIERKKEVESRKYREENEKAQKARIEAYWQEHLEEKNKLISEEEELNKQKNVLSRELVNTDIDTEIVQHKKEKELLQTKRNSLGLFKFIEKKELDALIEEKEKYISKLLESRKGPIEARIREINTRLGQIHNILTMDR